ncbi:unnamed protein product [Phytophthora lilii]|uniref:Unnamed protein product n=1 Tax=Phytophthora lilii TaxID=2077276 RepID=A0A9W6TTN0_9STRA|nr:unnamed protein product [Phytophthora lilii]
MTTTTDEMLYAQPASVHFGGFELERTAQQRVRVRNNSAKAVRLRYTFPTGKKGFRATFASAERPSFVSAGLCEEIVVSFTPPAGFQYYYDCIQVRCEEVAYGSSADVARSGATLIPLHAYPMVNEVDFPTRMDFGVVRRGTCARKYVDITCSVPVEFEYELRVTKPHPAFTIFPLTGTIPPRGEARIELEFRPLLFATVSAEMELHVSQLGFVPRVCTLAGSSSSTVIDSASTLEVDGYKSGLPSPNAPNKKPNSRSEARPPANKAINEPSGTKSRGVKSGLTESPLDDSTEEEELEKVRGIEIPHNLNSVTGVTFMLNQESGKLKPKDLKKAIAANRALRQQQREEQAKLSAGSASDDENESTTTLSFQTLVREEKEFLQRVKVSKQVKDMFFQQELREVAEAEKALEFQSHTVHLGQRLLSSEQIAYLTQLREENLLALTREQRGRLRKMFSSVLYESPIVSGNQHDENQHLMPDELKTAELPVHFAPAYTPDFKTHKNDMWARRQRVLRRLVRVVSKCILRLRAQKRLNRIRAWLGGARTRAQVREKVALDWQSSAQFSGVKIAKHVKQNSTDTRQNMEQIITDRELITRGYYLPSFPLVEESTAQKSRKNIDLPADWDLHFNTFTFMELKPRDEALLMGHEPVPLPALPTYVPQERGRLLREGAKGECGVVSSLLLQPNLNFNLLSAGSEHAHTVSIPSMLEMMPSDTFLSPQASVRPLMEIQGPRETDPSYALRPRRVFRTPPSSFFAWQSCQIGLQSVVGAHDEASLYLSDVFAGSAERKHVEPVLPSRREPATAVEDLSLFGDVWNIASTTMPPLASQAGDIPSLSDSESDDDEEHGSARQISWNHAIELFEDLSNERGDEKEGGLHNVYEDGELLGAKKGVYSFERYRHLIRQERAYNIHRHKLFERLPKVGKLQGSALYRIRD